MAKGRAAAQGASSGAGGVSDGLGALNEVRLRGRLSADPEERTLPSGDVVVSFRVVVDRVPARTDRRGASVDTLDCAAFRAGVRRTVLRWEKGDVVEVAGALHRRFYAAGGARLSRHEVEVGSAARRARAAERGVAP